VGGTEAGPGAGGGVPGLDANLGADGGTISALVVTPGLGVPVRTDFTAGPSACAAPGVPPPDDDGGVTLGACATRGIPALT
jgi:hypothetical protein